MGLFGSNKKEVREKILVTYVYNKIDANEFDNLRTRDFYLAANRVSVHFLFSRLEWEDRCYRYIDFISSKKLFDVIAASLYVYLDVYDENQPWTLSRVDGASGTKHTVLSKDKDIGSFRKIVSYYYGADLCKSMEKFPYIDRSSSEGINNEQAREMRMRREGLSFNRLFSQSINGEILKNKSWDSEKLCSETFNTLRESLWCLDKSKFEKIYDTPFLRLFPY